MAWTTPFHAVVVMPVIPPWPAARPAGEEVEPATPTDHGLRRAPLRRSRWAATICATTAAIRREQAGAQPMIQAILA